MSSNNKEKSSGRAELQRGYYTPEPSLGPDVARNQAEKDRQATIAEVAEESTQNSQGAITEGSAKHQKEKKKKGKGKSVQLLEPQQDEIETERSPGSDSVRNQAKKNQLATVEEEAEESTENSAKQQKKEKKKGKGKSAQFLLPELDKLETNRAEGAEKVKDFNQEASVNVESTKTSDHEATKNKSNGLFVGSQKSSQTQSKKDGEDKEGNNRTTKSDEEVMRILNTDSKFHFKVLGLNDLRDGPKVPRAFRKLSLIVHPDKNKHPKAQEAFTSK
jgi:hypothetical protein